MIVVVGLVIAERENGSRVPATPNHVMMDCTWHSRQPDDGRKLVKSSSAGTVLNLESSSLSFYHVMCCICSETHYVCTRFSHSRKVVVSFRKVRRFFNVCTLFHCRSSRQFPIIQPPTGWFYTSLETVWLESQLKLPEYTRNDLNVATNDLVIVSSSIRLRVNPAPSSLKLIQQPSSPCLPPKFLNKVWLS